ncbi:hypothetical protein [Bartonella grahamii]|uniref:hypothetical protein n=1 Tax=Bartonella grahamii TaxID=33045 RepID=UPI002360668F|nr:hypothetical protein [Bartonella grahamii]
MAEEKETDKKSDFLYSIRTYTLTEDFLLKMEQIGKEYENLLPELKASNIPCNNTIKEFTAYISNQPKLMNILRKYNLSPKDYVIGLMAL